MRYGPCAHLTSLLRHHYWIRLRAWVSGQQYFHACNVSLVFYSNLARINREWEANPGFDINFNSYIVDDVDELKVDELKVDKLKVDKDYGGSDLPIPLHGGVTILPDTVLYSGPAVVPEVPLDGIERLRRRLGR